LEFPEARYNLGQESHSIDLIDPLNELDELSWGFRIEKMQERGDTAIWRVFFVNPQNVMWYEKTNKSLLVALSEAVQLLKHHKTSHSNGSTHKIIND